MKELKCPQCGKVFSVDEAGYAEIVSQVRTAEFDNELERRMKELHQQHAAEEKARVASKEQVHQSELFKKDQTISEKDNEIAQLKAQIASEDDRKRLAVNTAVADKNQEIATLRSTIEQDAKNLEIAVLKERQQAEEAAQAKDKEIAELKSQAKLAASEASLREAEIRTELEGKLQLAKSEAELHEKSIREDYESKLKVAQEQVDYYKDLKTKMSTKMVGETLEVHCDTIFNGEMRPMFPNAYFEKDNDASGGSKGDFIFRDTEDGVEYISIMFEMKNEMDETASKHKNEDFFKKLDADRSAKGCEYAVLVSLLEPDSDLYNSGIVDVSHRYPKMYVIRPQFFKAMITLLVNAAKKSLEYKKQLILAQSKEVDVTNFENKLNEFRKRFGDHYTRAAGKFDDAIKKIDETIKKLQDIKKSFELSENYLRLANQDTEELTIRKLTYNNPTMKAKFNAAQGLSNLKSADKE